MINSDPETIAAFQRARCLKAAAVVTLMFSLAVIALTAPDKADSDLSVAPATLVLPAYESSRDASDFGRGSDVDDRSTGGVDMHG
ncbi:MAG: hypothetical protein ACXW13_01405 [Burkholderiaceae bacterium]